MGNAVNGKFRIGGIAGRIADTQIFNNSRSAAGLSVRNMKNLFSAGRKAAFLRGKL